MADYSSRKCVKDGRDRCARRQGRGAAPPQENAMLAFLRRLAGHARRAPRTRPTLERLEDRTVPSGLAVPALNSLPGARASLWLDFTSLPTQNWGSYQNVTTPVFDLDGDPTSFSPQELAVITEVWQRVAEIYSPFDINVTTVQPADLSHGKTQIVAVGGSYNDWLHEPAGGISYVGSFTNPYEPNISHIFVDGTDGVAQYIAVAAAHEVGHAFGLEHQAVFSATGALSQEYNPGTASEAPIMGLAYSAARALWWVGPADSNGTEIIQNDEAVIAGAANGFGLRPDPYGQSLATATPLGYLNGVRGDAGVLDTPASADFFSFTTTGGVASFTVNPAAVGGMLHATLELWSQGRLIAVGSSPTAMGASITANLPAGSYVIEAASYGGVGDIGQYTLTAQVPQNWGPYVASLYNSLLNRAPSAAELSTVTAAMNGGNVTPAQLVQAFLHSGEYRADVVQADFAHYLGRSASAGELSVLTTLLGQGFSEQNLAAAVLASGESFADRGDSFAAWIAAVYQDLDGRAATAFEAGWWAQAHADGWSLYQIASTIVGSAEADAHLVAVEYDQLLGRTVDSAGMSGFLALLQGGYDWNIVPYGLAASQEYIQKHLN